MKDKNIYFPISKMVRTRFNIQNLNFEQMDISGSDREWKRIFPTPELIKQLEEKRK